MSFKLQSKDGSSMFVCRAEDNLNLDQFETDLEYDEGDAVQDLHILNLAASFIGEHECIFDPIPLGIHDSHLMLMVTTEANNNKETSNTEFKAEIFVKESMVETDIRQDNDIFISCPNSGDEIIIYS